MITAYIKSHLPTVNFILLFNLHWTFLFLLQAHRRSHARVSIRNDISGIGQRGQLDGGVWCRSRHRTVRPLTGIRLIIVGCTRRVVVLTARIRRRVGHVVGWKLTSLARLLRIRICKWHSLWVYQKGFEKPLTYCKIACHRHLWSRLCSSPRRRSLTMSAFCASFVCFETRLWPSITQLWLMSHFAFSIGAFINDVRFFLRKHENSKKRFIMISDVIYECSVFNLSCLPVARSNLSWRQSRSVVVDTNICWSETPSPARAVGCSCRPFVDDAADHSQSQTHLENVEEGKMN